MASPPDHPVSTPSPDPGPLSNDQTSTPTPSTSRPSRSIRAHYDSEHITVYQAYSTSIATAAVASQRLSASPNFNPTRTTWIKPSWCWMLYRSGYSYKDANQSRILALTMRHEHFEELLSHARVAGEDRAKGEVVVQWDPERSVRIGRMDGVRSIQIGVPGSLGRKWVDEWIVGIEDVTERARELKRVLDEEAEVSVRELVERGLVPVERGYDQMLGEEVKRRLGMDGFREVREEMRDCGRKGSGRRGRKGEVDVDG